MQNCIEAYNNYSIEFNGENWSKILGPWGSGQSAITGHIIHVGMKLVHFAYMQILFILKSSGLE